MELPGAPHAVPTENLRIPAALFGALWSAAERGAENADAGDYVAGVILTCRWLAAVPDGAPEAERAAIPRAPLHGRPGAATPETIGREYALAVAYLGAPSSRAADREFARGVAATLDWAWNGLPEPPLEFPR